MICGYFRISINKLFKNDCGRFFYLKKNFPMRSGNILSDFEIGQFHNSATLECHLKDFLLKLNLKTMSFLVSY